MMWIPRYIRRFRIELHQVPWWDVRRWRVNLTRFRSGYYGEHGWNGQWAATFGPWSAEWCDQPVMTWVRLEQLAREVGAVADVARRRSDPDAETRQMIARLDDWRARILAVLAPRAGGEQ